MSPLAASPSAISRRRPWTLRPIRAEIEECATLVHRLIPGLEAPDYAHLLEMRSSLERRSLPVPTRLTKGIEAGNRCSAAVNSFAGDVRAYASHRNTIDAITLVNLAADLYNRQPSFIEMIAEATALIEQATT
jgi:hypothetical protein